MNTALLKSMGVDNPPTPTKISVRHRAFSQLPELLTFLRNQSGSGWVCWSSETSEATPLSALPEDRYLLSADACLSDTASLSVRQTATGWSVWTYTEGAGDEVWAEDIAYQGVESGQHKWRVFWKASPECAIKTSSQIDVFRPFAARYLGKE